MSGGKWSAERYTYGPNVFRQVFPELEGVWNHAIELFVAACGRYGVFPRISVHTTSRLVSSLVLLHDVCKFVERSRDVVR